MTKITNLLRYAADMPFSKGMILADEFGVTVTVEAVTSGDRVTLTGGWNYSAKLVRGSYQFLVCTTEVLEDETSCVSDCSDEDREDGLYWRASAGEAEAYFATEAEAHAWVEALRAEALAEIAQHEDDLRREVLDRAEEEWQRKNLGFVFSEA